MGVWAPDLHTYSPHKAASQFALFAAIFTGFAATVYNFYPDKVAVSWHFLIGWQCQNSHLDNDRSLVLILTTV